MRDERIATETLGVGEMRKAGSRPLPLRQRIPLLILPVLACFGPAIPVAGPIFGFRLAVLFLVVASLPWRRINGSWLVLISRVLAVVWGLVALVLLLLRGASVYTWPEAVSLSFGLLLLVALTGLHSPRRVLGVLLKGWLLAYFATGVVAFREIVFGVPFGNYYQQEVSNPILEGLGSASTFSNPNNYAFFLLVSLPVLILGLANANSALQKLLHLLAVITLPVLMLATGSRIGLLILAVVGALFAFAFLRAKWVLISTAAFALVALIFPRVLDEALGSVVSQFSFAEGFQLQGFVSGIFAETSMMVRVSLIQNGFEFWLNSYLLGVGTGGFEAEMLSGQGTHPTLGIESPHSGVIEILSQFGILVFVPFSAMMILLFVTGWKAFIRKSATLTARVGGLALVTLTAAFPVVTLMNGSFLEPSSSWLFLGGILVIGIAISESSGTLLAPDKGELEIVER